MSHVYAAEMIGCFKLPDRKKNILKINFLG